MALKNINLQVKQGELLCIVGDVGAGKSSLLSALIGDMLYAQQSLIGQYGGLEQHQSL